MDFFPVTLNYYNGAISTAHPFIFDILSRAHHCHYKMEKFMSEVSVPMYVTLTKQTYDCNMKLFGVLISYKRCESVGTLNCYGNKFSYTVTSIKKKYSLNEPPFLNKICIFVTIISHTSQYLVAIAVIILAEWPNCADLLHLVGKFY